ncbi:hypothetical protein [Streptomyces sp. NPDC005760]|uniref:hypothetical protein n=1 Tax=Streptomyces sp. NPDC005760 TaxID=3156718 RepID=UPI0033FEFA49
MPETRWNGELCTARRITAIVADNGAFPLYWARHLVGTRRSIVEVTYGSSTFYLDDEDGSGWNKVTHGGSPHWAHSNITIAPDSIQPRCGHAEPDEAAACRHMHTRTCPPSYNGPCGERPCARFESDDPTPWQHAGGDLAAVQAALERVRETCQGVRARRGPGGMINATQILGLLSLTWPDGSYEAPAVGDGS